MRDWRDRFPPNRDKYESNMNDLVFSILQLHGSAPMTKVPIVLERPVFWIDGCGHPQLAERTVPDGTYKHENYCYYLDQVEVHAHRIEFDLQVKKQLETQEWTCRRLPYLRPTSLEARPIAATIERDLLKVRLTILE